MKSSKHYKIETYVFRSNSVYFQFFKFFHETHQLLLSLKTNTAVLLSKFVFFRSFLFLEIMTSINLFISLERKSCYLMIEKKQMLLWTYLIYIIKIIFHLISNDIIPSIWPLVDTLDIKFFKF